MLCHVEHKHTIYCDQVDIVYKKIFKFYFAIFKSQSLKQLECDKIFTGNFDLISRFSKQEIFRVAIL